MLGGIGMPGIVIVGLLAAGKPEAVGIIGILAGIFLPIVTLGALMAHRATAPITEANGEAAFTLTTGLASKIIVDIESIPGLDLVESVPVAPQSEVTLQASKSTGSALTASCPGTPGLSTTKATCRGRLAQGRRRNSRRYTRPCPAGKCPRKFPAAAR